MKKKQQQAKGRYEFGECAAKDSHGVTERTEERMAGFVNEEIGKVNKKKTRSVERGVEEEERI